MNLPPNSDFRSLARWRWLFAALSLAALTILVRLRRPNARQPVIPGVLAARTADDQEQHAPAPGMAAVPSMQPDREELIRRALEQSDPDERKRLWEEMAGNDAGEGRSSLLHLLSRVRQIPALEFRDEFIKALYAGWASVDPAVAKNHVENVADLRVRRLGSATVMRMWTGRETEGPLRWFEHQPAGRSIDRDLHFMLTDALARLDPQTASVRLEDSESDRVRREFVGPLLGRLLEHEPALAAVVLLRAEPEPMQLALGEHVVSRWARRSPEAAAALVAVLPPEEIPEQATVWVVAGWLASDPEAAAAWAELLQEGAMREQTVQKLMSVWIGRDLVDAGNWLQTLPSRRPRNVAASVYCGHLASIDFNAALDWAATIQGAELRRRAAELMVARVH